MIYFVGAGSGAVDLITIRGANLLKVADFVIWAGSLVNPELLEFCKRDAQIFDSSKMNLLEIEQIFETAHEQKKTCIRLHTGDPSIFGSIFEQIAFLKKKNIPFQIVPGVSSLFGAAASLCAEFTIPSVSQSLIITRIAGNTAVPQNESLCSLAEHGTSMAIFLSADKIESVVAELLKNKAYTTQTPAAVVYRATWQDEKIVRGTLSDIAQKTKDAKIFKHALIFVGDFLNGIGSNSFLYSSARKNAIS